MPEGTQLCTEHWITSFRDRNTQHGNPSNGFIFSVIKVRKFFIPTTSTHCTILTTTVYCSYLQELLCRLVLIIFVGKSWESFHVQEFSTIETNSFLHHYRLHLNVFRWKLISKPIRCFPSAVTVFASLRRAHSALFGISFTSCFKGWFVPVGLDHHFTSDPSNGQKHRHLHKFCDVICTAEQLRLKCTSLWYF